MSSSESGSELVLELAEEFLERYRRGERPPLREYVERHPELAAEIKEVFPAMAMMENIAVADESMEEGRAPRAAGSSASILTQLGDYRIIREIGHGGMGVVYEAEQVSLGRHVALKVLPKQALADTKHKRRFEREAKAAAKLHHTNIVPIFGVGEHEGVPYYVMQFIQGLGLDVVLDELNHMQGGAGPTSTGRSEGGELRVSRRDVSAADVARSLMTGAFQRSGDEDDADQPKAHAGYDATLDQPTIGVPAESVSALPQSGLGRLSDSFTVSSSSITLPGTSVTGRKSAEKKLNYWQSVANVGRQVAEALEYAHKQGILHRDVKPSNLLLDLRGTVWVTDFGLAKVAGPGGDNLTHTGDILGTLRYMPPEAFEGKSDARSDVYSLGMTLYELLAMRPAFAEKERNKLIKQVTTGEPPRLDKVRSEIPRDLVTIVQKSIAREPSRRYATAEELAADLQRFSDDEPIQARRQTHLERYWRWARHNPGIAVLGGVLTAVLVLVTAGSLLAAGYFHQLRQEAIRQEAAANEQRLVAQDKALEALQERTAAKAAEREMQKIAAQAEAAKEVAQRENYRSTIKLAESMLQGDVQARYRVADILWGAQPELRGWEWGHLMARCPLEEWSLQTNQAGLDTLALSVDGRFLATAGGDGTVALWDSWTRQELWRRQAGRALTLEIDPRGRYVAVGSAEESAPSVRILDLATGQIVHEAADKGRAHVAFGPDGKNIYLFSAAKLERWGTGTWARLASVPYRHSDPLGWLKLFVDSAGAHVGVQTSASDDPTTRRFTLLDAQTLQSVADLNAFIPTFASRLRSVGKMVLDSGQGRLVYSDGPRLYRKSLAPDGSVRPQKLLFSHPTVIDHFVEDARSETVIAASKDGTVSVCDADGNIQTLSHGLPIRGLVLFPDGRFVTGGADGLLKCWKPSLAGNLAVNTAIAPSPASDGVLAFANNGASLLYRTWEPDRHYLYDLGTLTYRIFAPPDRKLYGRRFPVLQAGTNDLVVDGETGISFFSRSSDGSGYSKTRSLEMARPFSVAFDAAGRTLVATTQGPDLVAFDLRSNQRLPRPEAHGIGQVSINPAGTRGVLLTGPSLQVWDLATGRLLQRHDLGDGGFSAPNGDRDRYGVHHDVVHVRIPVFHPNGDLLVFVHDSDSSSSLALWDMALGRMQASIPGVPGRRITSCAFSPDGERIYAACSDGKMRIWDWRLGKELFALSDAAQAVTVAAHPDGLTIAYSGWAPSLRLAKALPWSKATQRNGDFYRAVDDLRTFTANRPTWAKSQTMQFDDRAAEPKDDVAATIKLLASQTTATAEEAEMLGDIQRRRGQPAEAITHYDKALAIRQRLVAAEPGKAHLQYRLASLYEKRLAVETTGDPAKRAAVLQQAIDRWQKLVAGDRPQPLGWRYLVDFRLRHSATLGASLAAAERGMGQPLDDAAKAKLHRQTLDALNAELSAWGKVLESGPPEARPFMVRTLTGWQQDSDLGGIRVSAAVAKLPAEDQKACAQLWTDVAALLKKAEEPANNTDRLRLAQLAYNRNQFAVATRHFAEALANEPKLGDDPRRQHRYIAACAAAQLAAGQGQEKPPLDDAAKAKLRAQALGWLKAELTAWGQLLESGLPREREAILQTLMQWQQDSDLAVIRDATALAKLPADERTAFTQLWADVAKSVKVANAKVGAYLLEQLPEARRTLPKDSPQLAGMLAHVSLSFLEAGQWAEAEPLLRECRAIREKAQPDSWTTFNTVSSLGGALLGQKKYAEAEPLLLKGYQGMKERDKTIPALGKPRLLEAVTRLVQLYEATNKKDEAVKWQAELRTLAQPATPEANP